MSNRPNKKPSTGAGRKVAPRPSASQSPSRLPLIIGIAVLVIVVLGVVAFFSPRTSEQTAPSSATREFGSVTALGAALPPMPDGGGADPAVGTVAPTITSQTFEGKELSFPQQGTPAVIAFVAHWCPHCQAEVPKLAKYLQQNGMPTGVNLYTVSTSAGEDKPNYPASEWLAREQWKVPTVVDDGAGKAAKAYGLSSFPYFVAVDANGKVVKRASGELSEQEFQDLIDNARAATPGTTPAVAR